MYDSFAFEQAWRCDETSGWVEESRMEGHSDWVRDVAWAPSLGGTEGRSVIASCSQDRRVVIWSKESDASTQVLVFFNSRFSDGLFLTGGTSASKVQRNSARSTPLFKTML